MSIHSISLYPVFRRAFVMADHHAGQLATLGDDLGRDFMIAGFTMQRPWLCTYRTDGTANEDWFGWHEDVLAPMAGTVVEVYENGITNEPGKQTPGRASSIIIEGADGVSVLLGHICEPAVRAGDTVRAGQTIAKVGNDGYARNPHIHVGAWKGDQPLAIEIDRQRMADVYNGVGEIYWMTGMTEEDFVKQNGG